MPRHPPGREVVEPADRDPGPRFPCLVEKREDMVPRGTPLEPHAGEVHDEKGRLEEPEELGELVVELPGPVGSRQGAPGRC